LENIEINIEKLTTVEIQTSIRIFQFPAVYAFH